MRSSQFANHQSSQSKIFRTFLALVLCLGVGAQTLGAQTSAAKSAPQARLVISDSLGLNGILNLCVLLNCSTVEGLGDPKGQLFMIEIPAALAPLTSLLNLNLLGLVSIIVSPWTGVVLILVAGTGAA